MYSALEHQDLQKDLQIFRLGLSGVVHRALSGGSRRRCRRSRVRQDRRPQPEVRRRIRFLSASQSKTRASSLTMLAKIRLSAPCHELQ